MPFDFKMGGREETLRPSLRAVKAISGQCGSIQQALANLGQFNFDTYVAVAAAGLGRKADEKFENEVFEADMTKLVGPFSDFVGALARGGRSDKDGEGDTPTGER